MAFSKKLGTIKWITPVPVIYDGCNWSDLGWHILYWSTSIKASYNQSLLIKFPLRLIFGDKIKLKMQCNITQSDSAVTISLNCFESNVKEYN